MLRDYMYKYYPEGGCNCAETVLRAANDCYGLGLHDRDMRMVGAFGGGIQVGSSCGAVLGAAAVLSVKYIETTAHESADIFPVTRSLMKKFSERYGSTMCRDIKPQSFDRSCGCQRTIETALDILEETINEYEASRQ